MKKETPWLFVGCIGDEMLNELNADYFINHDIEQPGFNGKVRAFVLRYMSWQLECSI